MSFFVLLPISYTRHHRLTPCTDHNRMITFYPMSAILTIFCNILLFPLDPRAEEDLTLLGSVPDLIKGIRLQRLKDNEAAHMTMVADFVAELTRLGNCAIRKARYSVSPR